MASPGSLAYPDRFYTAAAYAGFGAASSGSVSRFQNDVALLLYGLHQQATAGPCNVSKPRAWNPVEQSKWTSWHGLGNMPSTEAMRLFVKILEEEDPGWYSRVPEFNPQPVVDIEMHKPKEEANTVPASTNGTPSVREPKTISENGSSMETQDKVVILEGLSTVSAHEEWTALSVSGQRPKPRYEHGATILQEKMYIFGGNHNGRYLSDLQVLDLKSLSWSKIDAKLLAETSDSAKTAQISPCAGHSLITCGNKFFSVAGHTKDPSESITVKEFDPHTCTWSIVRTYGKPPVSRGGQSVTLVGRTLVVFGGEDAKRGLLNDLHILDLETMTWDDVDAIGTPPAPRSDHAAACHAGRYLLIFGGGSHATCFNDLHVLDLETMEWSRPKQQGLIPSPRAGHAGATVGDNWYIVGGGNNKSGVSETLVLNMSTLTWSVVSTVEGGVPLASEGMTLLYSNYSGEDYLISFGGYNGRYSNEVYALKLSVKQSSTNDQPVSESMSGVLEPEVEISQDGKIREIAVDNADSKNRNDEANEQLLAALKAEKEELEATLDRERLQTVQLKEEITEAEARNAELIKELQAVRGQLASEQSRCFKLEVDVAELRQKLQSLDALEREVELLRRQKAASEQAALDELRTVQDGPEGLSAEQKEDKEQKNQDPTVIPTSQRQPVGVHVVYGILVQEDEELTNILDASSENNLELLQSCEMVQAGAAGLSAEQEEQDEIQVGAAGLSNKHKKGKEKEKKVKKKNKQERREVLEEEQEKKKRRGQIASVKRYMQNITMPGKYNAFLDDENRAKLQEITESLNSVDENTWDDAANAYYLERIESINKIVKKRFDDDEMRGKRILQFETGFDQGVKEKRAQAERNVAEAKRSCADADSRLAEIDEIEKLVNNFKISVRRLDDQRSLVPTEEIIRKLEMGEKILKWLEEKLVQLQYLLQLDYNQLVTNINAWNKELMDTTFWDHSPEEKEKTILGRDPVQDFEKVEIERLIFDPMRSSLDYFIGYLRDRFCDHPQFGNIESKMGQLDKIYKCRLLEYQTTAKKQPPRWIILEMRSGRAKAGMYIRSDNLYIGGFYNQQEQIYELSNSTNKPLIKDSKPFGCDCDYPSLMNFERKNKAEIPEGQDVERLKEILLNRVAMSNDIVAMSEYDHRKKDSKTKEEWEEILKRVQIGISRMAICIPEVCRLLFIFACVEEGWLTILGTHLTNLLIAHMRHWKDISFAIRNDYEGRELSVNQQMELGMVFAYEGFKVLCLALNAKGNGISKGDSKGDGPTPQPPPPAGNDEEPKDDGAKGQSGTPPGPEKDSKNGAGEGGSSTPPPGTKIEGGDSQGDGGHGTDKFELSGQCILGGHGTDKFEMSGQCLLNIFSIHTNTHLIKSISVYDDRCGKCIYNSSGVDIARFERKKDLWLSSHTGRDPSDYMEELVISGPDRAMSALPWYILEVDVGDEKGVFDLPWKWEDRTVIDKPMTQSIFTSKGDVHITSAVFSNALQVSIEVMLFVPKRFLRPHEKELQVLGTLELGMDDFAFRSKIFQDSVSVELKNIPEVAAEDYENGMVSLKVPLNRSVFALPATSVVHVVGTLLVGGLEVSIFRFIDLTNKNGFYTWTPPSSGLSRLVKGAAIRINRTSPF